MLNLIENENVRKFYVGNNGRFDLLAKKTLEKLAKGYSNIEYFIVLAYLPVQKNEFDYTDYSHTIYFDEIITAPKRLAIYKRNELMVNKSDFVITFVRHNLSGAAIFKELAQKSNKKVIDLKINGDNFCLR